MERILLFGASGHLGKAICKEAVKQGYHVTAVVRSQEKASMMTGIASDVMMLNVMYPTSLKGKFQNYDIVISALGKSVSFNDKSKDRFAAVDLDANTNILNEAIKNNVKKFVYVSAFHAEQYQYLEYFRVHHAFSERLITSSLNYSIIKPPALFSAFIDLIDLAKKNQLVNLGKGDKLTNPIYEGDLAIVCVNSIKITNATVEAGGRSIYSRSQLNHIIQQAVNPAKKIRTIPVGLIKIMLPLLKVIDRNMFDRMAFIIEVINQDTIAPQIGEMSFEAYITNYFASQSPFKSSKK